MFGMNSTKTLYKWVKAMDGGKGSEAYDEILSYFTT
jgi:hypothetical protein